MEDASPSASLTPYSPSGIICLTKDRVCVARGAGPRTMTDHIPLEEIESIQVTQHGYFEIESAADGINSGREWTFKMLQVTPRRGTDPQTVWTARLMQTSCLHSVWVWVWAWTWVHTSSTGEPDKAHC